jgi:eukaryotic-like serine/threonine-protein kinase
MWKSKDDIDVIRALLEGDVQSSPRAVKPDINPALDEICRRALAVRPIDRYATAEEFHVDLERFLSVTPGVLQRRRELGTSLSELFKDKRTEIQKVIDTRLKQLKERGSIQMRPGVATDDPSGELPVISEERSSPSEETRSATARAVTGGSTTPRAKRSRMPLVVGAIALALSSVLALVVWSRVEAPHAPVTPVADAGAEVHLRLLTSPETAKILIDGQPVTAPFDGKVPRDERTHVVRVEAEGFDPQVHNLTFSSDLSLAIALTKTAAQPSSTTAASATASTDIKRPVTPPPFVPTKRTPTTPPTTPTTTHVAPHPSLDITRER